MKLSVIGTGYVGLVQGAIFAEIGHDVICVDSLEDKIKSIESFCKTGVGELPVHEPGLPDVVKSNYDNGRLKFTTDLEYAVKNSSAIFITVGTPFDNNIGQLNMNFVYTVAEQIGNYLNADEPKLVVLKSTVPVNTHKHVQDILSKKSTNKFHVVSNPEFMAQGRAVEDCRAPSRIVIGTDSEYAKQQMLSIYNPIIKKRNVSAKIMDNVSAELCKYFSNAYLALQVDATNKFAELTRVTGGDWRKIQESIKLDKRIGRFLHDGLGFGGSCFEKDVLALANTMDIYGLGISSVWLNKVIKYNESQRLVMADRIFDYFSPNQSGKTIAIWGLSFKPDTNDVRGAASIPSILELTNHEMNVRVYDPAAMSTAKLELENLLKGDLTGITFCNKKEETLEGSDALLVTVEWPEFYSPDFSEIKAKLKVPAIFDGKDIYDLDLIRSLGFDYFSIGRPDVRR